MNNNLVVQGEMYIAMKEQATMLVKSGFLPKDINTPEKAMAIALKGVEVGFPMMQSFAQIHIINGKPSIGAEGMHFLIKKNCPEAVINIKERTTECCIIKASRPKHEPVEFIFSMEDAKKAQLLANPSWQKYPRNMLFARCLSDVARSMFPDCIGGISYTPEELGADVDIEGNIVGQELRHRLSDLKKITTEEKSEPVTEGA